MTGDFCGWRPDCLKIGKTNDISIRFVVPKELEKSEFKLTRGTWESEACHLNGEPLSNLRFRYSGVLKVLNIPAWCDSPTSDGKRLNFNYYFESLETSRRVDIYIPTNLDINSPESSFILFLDGQNIFDKERAAFGIEWRADEIAEQLGLEDRILVSIDNGGRNRTEEYHYFKKGKQLAKELSEKFIPSICSKYFMKSSCKGNSIVGSSLGAIFAFTTAYEYSDTFSKSYSLSFPAFAYDDYVFKFIKEVRKTPLSESMFYFDYGGLGQDQTYGPHMQRFLGLEKVSKLRTFLRVYPFHGHNELNWSQRLAEILFIFN